MDEFYGNPEKPVKAVKVTHVARTGTITREYRFSYADGTPFRNGDREIVTRSKGKHDYRFAVVNGTTEKATWNPWGIAYSLHTTRELAARHAANDGYGTVIEIKDTGLIIAGRAGETGFRGKSRKI